MPHSITVRISSLYLEDEGPTPSGATKISKEVITMDNPAETHCTIEAYEALYDTVMKLMVKFDALQTRVDALADKEGGEIIKLQDRMTKLENTTFRKVII